MSTTDKRPAKCRCHAVDQGLPCYWCFQAGFDDPNPNAPDPLEGASDA